MKQKLLHIARTEKKILIGAISVFVVILGLSYIPRCVTTKVCGATFIDKIIRSSVTITAPRATIHAEVANTPESQELGLSGRTGIAEGKGMLFAFSFPGHYGFWMKDMKFPIDMVWINASGTVVYVVENAKPEDYPAQYINKPDASYVLEIGANKAREYGIYLGVKLGLSGQK